MAVQLQTETTLSVENVSRWYGNVVAVNDITFELRPGITGLLGPNGAGKSTLLHMLSGLLKPSSGDAKVMGETAWRNPSIYRLLGLVPEREAVYDFLTGLDFVRLSARLHGLPDVDAAARRALEEVELTGDMDRRTGTYSKGMKQRVKIAAAIVHRPSILLLDEPFNGADPRQRLRMMAMLRRMARDGATIVFSSHILEEVERLAENVLVIVAGRLAATGDFHEIRRLMTDRPHSLRLRSSDNRSLAAALIGQPSIFGVEIDGDSFTVRTSDLLSFAQLAPRVARDAGVTLMELSPTDESLESVFSYLVRR
ncbi:MAG TPA: ABC transporter ATP-binding protein [Dehalococcoidia bacterium]|jgi:ABC-2 type transport system ATP-binding protein|nr:ABC transporter ATP-binding protein [Dehalococcoidia bacterium]